MVLSPNGDFAFVTGTSSKSLAVVNISIPEAPHVIGSVAGNFMQKASDLAISPDGRFVVWVGLRDHLLSGHLHPLTRIAGNVGVCNAGGTPGMCTWAASSRLP